MGDMDTHKNGDPIPGQFDSIESAADFWDTHSLADYEDQIHQVEIKVCTHRQRRVTLDPDVYKRKVGQPWV